MTKTVAAKKDSLFTYCSGREKDFMVKFKDNLSNITIDDKFILLDHLWKILLPQQSQHK